MPARFRLVLVVLLAFLLAWLMAPRTAGAQPPGLRIVRGGSSPICLPIPPIRS